MNIKGFFTTALGSALELGIGTSEDVLRHVTPDVLSTYLPRPLWARLLTACLGASRVDATVVVETIGIANLCEHVPAPIIWACLAEIGARALGGMVAPSPRMSVGLSPPPPPIASTPLVTHPPEPLAAIVAELEAEDRAAPPAPLRPRTGTRPPFRQAATGIGRLAGAKRPQVSASTSGPGDAGRSSNGADSSLGRTPRRGQTEADSFELETDVRHEAVPVDDEQLVDWSSSEETVLGADVDRKR